MKPAQRPRTPWRSTIARVIARRWWRLHPRRLLVAPRIGATVSAGDGEIEVSVDGMVCSVCAARTGAALAALPGVAAADVDLDRGRAVLRLDLGARVDVAEAQGTLDRVVVGGRLRRIIERLAGRRARPR